MTYRSDDRYVIHMTTNPSTAHVLLVQTAQGAVVGVRFASADAARAWEDSNPEIEAVGCVQIVSGREAVRIA